MPDGEPQPVAARRTGRGARRIVAAALACVLALAALLVAAARLGSPPRPAPGPPAASACVERALAVQRTSTPPAAGALRVGVHASLRNQGGRRGLCRTADLALASGARYLREDLDWSRIEPRPGRFRFDRYDAIFAVAASRGLTVLPLLDATPGWARPGADALPADPRAFARFVARVVARYGPGGDFWRARPGLAPLAASHFELYNEPFLAAGVVRVPDPPAYARLVRVAAAEGRRANPRARFLLAGETSWTTPSGAHRSWMDDLYRAVPDLGDHFDAVAVHPYSPDSPDHYTPGRGTRSQTRRLEQVRARLVAHGDAGKPVWITEIGWSTCPGGEECVSEASQAAYLRRLFELARTRWRGFVRAVVVYQLREYEPRDRGDKEGWYGLLRPDGSAKPAWAAFREAARGD
jgi:polysaccharide biosynthesis protein PslG